jgi:predicted O-methyltransferase YrrM
LHWLCQLAQQAPDGPGIEIGVYCGASLIAWSLARAGRGRSIGVDNWSYRDIANLKATCEENMKWANVAAQLIDADSEQAARQVIELLAFCFIDGDHTQPGIEKDIEVWIPKIASSGVLVFHDYGRHKRGCYVTEAVDAWQSKAKWIELGKVETTIGFRKPE